MKRGNTMSKGLSPGMNVGMRKKILLTVIVIATVISFALILLFIHSSNKSVMVPITTDTILAGEEIKPAKVAMREIGSFGLPDNMATKESQVIGKFANRDFGKDEFFFGTSLSSDYYKRISEKARYGAIAISTNLIQSVNAEVKENDFVKIILVFGGKENGEPGQVTEQTFNSKGNFTDGGNLLVTPKELEAVRVLGLYSGDATSVEWNKDQMIQTPANEMEKNKKTVSPSMIIFDARPVQQAMLASVQYNGAIHMVVLPESVQQQYRERWGINKDGSMVNRGGVDEEALSRDTEKIGRDSGTSMTDEERNEVNNSGANVTTEMPQGRTREPQT